MCLGATRGRLTFIDAVEAVDELPSYDSFEPSRVSGFHAGFGRVLGVRHSDEVTTLYAHCWATRVGVGDRVNAGTVLGFVGDTGRATGPHLHFEVRVRGRSVNPLAVTEVTKRLMRRR